MDDAAVSARRESEKAEPSTSTGADDVSAGGTSATMVAADAATKDTSAGANATSATPACSTAKADKKAAAAAKKKKQLKTCCKRKHKGKGKCTNKQCFVHKKREADSDSDSDSDSSDDESDESEDSDSDSSDSDSSSSEDERRKRRRARKKKAAAKKKKAAAKKKKSRRRRDDSSDSDSDSDSSSDEEKTEKKRVVVMVEDDSETTRKRQRKKKPAKAEPTESAAETPAADSNTLATATATDPATTATGTAASGDILQQVLLLLQNSNKAATPVVVPVADEKADRKKGKGKEKSKKKSGKPEYKRVDQLWDSNIHDYKLTETAEEQPDGFDGFVFHVRRRFDWENKYRSTCVDIKSKHLRDALAEIMKDVKAISLAENEPSIDPNMLFLYLEEMRTFYSKTLKQRIKKEKKKKAIKKLKTIRAHLKLMIGYLDKDYEQTKKTLIPMLKAGTITFDLLWALFKPNSIAYTTTYGSADHPRCFKVDLAYQDKSFTRGEYYVVEGRYLEYDGKDYGLGDLEMHIDHFKGPRKITSLATYPIQYHKDEKTVRAELIERGKKFVSLSGMNFKFMKGLAFQKRKKQLLKFNINGRVMVDPKTFRRVLANYMISSVKQQATDEGDSDDESCSECENEVSDSYDDNLASDVEESGGRRYRVVGHGPSARVVEVDSDDDSVPQEKLDKLPAGAEGEGDAGKVRQFSEEELLISSPVVLGFSFTEKDWFEFSLSGISDIVWNEGAFDSLVLPAAHKNIVKAQVSSHKFHGTETIDDIIQGKGKGLVFVLHGPPGVGKTLTAEGIAEFLKCPLYAVSAGDLGTDARIEHELNKIMDIAHSWGAVLLLDEADVFLEQREHQDVNRNALVSIFLRLLEYFQGILFLTTNRVETFDEAFQSRIHIALKYSELTRSAKREIWKMFLLKVGESGGAIDAFREADYDELAKSKLNGRQIKNTVKSAQALARHENVPLNMRHVKEVLEVAQAFERDLKGGTGYEEALRSYS